MWRWISGRQTALYSPLWPTSPCRRSGWLHFFKSGNEMFFRVGKVLILRFKIKNFKLCVLFAIQGHQTTRIIIFILTLEFQRGPSMHLFREEGKLRYQAEQLPSIYYQKTPDFTKLPFYECWWLRNKMWQCIYLYMGTFPAGSFLQHIRLEWGFCIRSTCGPWSAAFHSSYSPETFSPDGYLVSN